MRMSPNRALRLPVLDALDPFDLALRAHGLEPLRRGVVDTLQVNLGKRCNLACLHCHVEAGPKRTETMSHETAQRVVALLERSPMVHTLDLTGGAPELHPSFRWLVSEAHRLGKQVIDRCNLSVLFEPGMEDLAGFLAAHRVRIVASLPCYTEDNVDAQRGRGAFDASIRGLKLLNSMGYGQAGSELGLDLVYNPGGPFLPPAQSKLEPRYEQELRDQFGIEFHRLLTLTNMPIRRLAHSLERSGEAQRYQQLLEGAFNAETVPGVMCRSLVSVSWTGELHDCDFHQMLELPLGGERATLWDLERVDVLAGRAITTAAHCFGCTAGAGSSCSGALR